MKEKTVGNKSALIVGASRGLGLAIVQELLERGMSVVGTVRKGKRTPLHDLADKFPKILEIEYLDITDANQIAELKTSLSDKSFDLLFVNASLTQDMKPLAKFQRRSLFV